MSLSMRTYTVHLANADETLSRASRRILIHADVLKASKLIAGDVLALASAQETEEHKYYSVGIAWPSSEGSTDAISVSQALLSTARLEEGSKVRIHSLSSKVPQWLPPLHRSQEARTIHLREISNDSSRLADKVADAAKGKDRDWLPLLLRETLVDLKYLTPSQVVEVVYEGCSRRFAVQSVSTASGTQQSDLSALASDLDQLSLGSTPKLWTVGWDTFVAVVDESRKASTEETATKGIESGVPADAYNAVGGLDKQIAQIRDLIEIPLTRPELFRHFGLKPPRGILLHGPPGTGKTHLARAIAASTRSAVIVINGPELSSAYHGETEGKLRDVFADARARSPCIVVLDEVDALCPRREDGPGGEVEKRVVAQLLTIMDGMGAAGEEDEERVVVVATTNRPNAIDPALRRPGRFDREIEIGVPDAEARVSILNVLLAKTPHTLTESDLRTLAGRAHGYVGADLSAVVREAGTRAIKRWLAAAPAPAGDAGAATLTADDVAAALLSVRPSALRSVFLDSAPVRYGDIGGQARTVQALRECVEWPIRRPEAFARLGVRAPRGVLLYGPPGCSKTMLVRALATESGVNFVAVKGPELLNKYLGESERAVREIFRKARAAAPSIVFFDEIDALGTSRTAPDGAGTHEGVLTSLLNEIDGVEELVGVTVVAATNRPDILDSALMRPGRLDRQVYVGPPDARGREEILRIRTRKMSVAPGLDVAEIARVTEGYSGAELAALCQEAAMLTMRENVDAEYVPHEAFIAATKVVKKQITPEVLLRYQRFQEAV